MGRFIEDASEKLIELVQMVIDEFKILNENVETIMITLQDMSNYK